MSASPRKFLLLNNASEIKDAPTLPEGKLKGHINMAKQANRKEFVSYGNNNPHENRFMHFEDIPAISTKYK